MVNYSIGCIDFRIHMADLNSGHLTGLWVVIPFGIMVDSYRAIMKAFKVSKQHMRVAKGK